MQEKECIKQQTFLSYNIHKKWKEVTNKNDHQNKSDTHTRDNGRCEIKLNLKWEKTKGDQYELTECKVITFIDKYEFEGKVITFIKYIKQRFFFYVHKYDRYIRHLNRKLYFCNKLKNSSKKKLKYFRIYWFCTIFLSVNIYSKRYNTLISD